MKIIQLVARIEGSGVTRYIIELNKALKSEGHDVEIVYFNNNLKSNNDMQNIPNLKVMSYGQELIDYINSSDILLINALISVKADQIYKDNFYKLIRETKGPIKALFCNDHNIMGIKSYYGLDYLNDMDLLIKHIDKFVTFSPHNKIFQKIYSVYPEIMKKYTHMMLPYTFSDNAVVPFENKYRRITYLGRFANFKDPMRLTRNLSSFANNNYQVELRGIARTIASSCVPGFLYDFNENGERIGPAKNTMDLTKGKKLINELYPGQSEDLVHFNDRDITKAYMFGRYKREEGMDAISYSMFGCDFYYHKNPLVFGDTLEYCIAEIIDSGTIPVLDYDTIENFMIYKDGKRTNTSIITEKSGICLKKDGSNIDDVIKQMNELASNKELYDNYRKECLSFYKEFYNPNVVAKRLIKELTSDDNSEALAEWGF